MSGREPPAPDPMGLAQRATGVIAARRRGDHEGAQALMRDFADADERALGFYVVADLAVLLLAQASGDDVHSCLRTLSLALASGPEQG